VGGKPPTHRKKKKKNARKQSTPKKNGRAGVDKSVDADVTAVADGWSQLLESAKDTLAIVDKHKCPSQTVRKHQYATRSRVVLSSNSCSESLYYTRHEITCQSRVEGDVNAFDVRVPIPVSPATLAGLTQSRIDHDVVRLLNDADVGPAASVFLCSAPKDDPNPSQSLWSVMSKGVGGAWTLDFGVEGERTLLMVDSKHELR
jgi:hypothetical protein